MTNFQVAVARSKATQRVLLDSSAQLDLQRILSRLPPSILHNVEMIVTLHFHRACVIGNDFEADTCLLANSLARHTAPIFLHNNTFS
jgi:hypothetical protein